MNYPDADTGRPIANEANKEEPPKHPFEVRISIGGDDWQYVRRALKDLMEHVGEREPENCGLSSGGGGGCHSIDVFRREVSIEQYHKELLEWMERRRA